MTLSTIRHRLDDLGARLFRRDHPERRWRPADGGSPDGATAEERTLYRSFASAMLRERAAAAAQASPAAAA